MSSRSVASLAAIKSLWDSQQADVLSLFARFVVALIASKGYTRVQASQICKDFSEEYGLVIPNQPMVSILQRVSGDGYVEKKGVYYVPVKDRLVTNELFEATREFERKYRLLIRQFVDYANSEFDVEIDADEANDQFIAYFREYDLDILFLDRQVTSTLPEVSPSVAYQFLVASYIRHLFDNSIDTFNLVVDASLGHIFANALLVQIDESHDKAAIGSKLYLDIHFLFSALGINGPESTDSTLEALELYRSNGFELFIFRHTYDEFYGILESCLRYIDQPFDPYRASRALNYFKEEGYSESDLEQFILRVEDRLTALGMRIIEPPLAQELTQYQIDEEKLQQTIEDVYQQRRRFFRGDDKGFTLAQDIKSIVAIYKYRAGDRPHQLSEAKHMFVTGNAALALACKRYEEYEGKVEQAIGFTIPPIVTDVFITTLVWLRSPVADDISRKRLMAHCAAALQPNRELLVKLAESADRLRATNQITEQDVRILKESRVARNQLQKETLGDPERFSEQTVFDILEAVRDGIRAEEQQQFETERAEAEAEREKLRDLVKSEKQKTFNNLEDRLREQTGFKNKLDQRADRQVNYLIVLGFVFCAVFVLLVIYAIRKQGWDQIEPIAYVISIVIALASYVYLAVTRKEWSPLHVLTSIHEYWRARMYAEMGFDRVAYEQLQQELAEMRATVDHFHSASS